jgi:hypothetical protein
LPLKTTDAVEGETPAFRATSEIVGLRLVISDRDYRAERRAPNRFDHVVGIG